MKFKLAQGSHTELHTIKSVEWFMEYMGNFNSVWIYHLFYTWYVLGRLISFDLNSLDAEEDKLWSTS
jgi:hypothetical protein